MHGTPDSIADGIVLFIKKIPQKQTVQKRNAVHAEEIEGNGNLRRQKSKHKAGKKHRTDIVAKAEQELRFFFTELSVLIHIGRNFSSHGKAAQKTNDDTVKAAVAKTEQGVQQGTEKPREIFRQVQADHHTRQYHKRK